MSKAKMNKKIKEKGIYMKPNLPTVPSLTSEEIAKLGNEPLLDYHFQAVVQVVLAPKNKTKLENLRLLILEIKKRMGDYNVTD